ncbi:class I SAM-dependent DNA methyltransferase [Rhabdaerophilum calidifontis]|uniref:class I SAM-dependent DNA methyltransferase n=1 Tax=Rhabdaerophilum calidifontis TaxID=2604328 RepID=UPI00123BA872|nr:methyltransferase domain-containing protein [Rhabdaerophilum calidifontis]
MPNDLSTSGDLIADRRFAYARAALAEGDAGAARDLFAQVLERAPVWPPALHGLAEAALLGDDPEAARAAAAACLALDPSDRLGAGLILARIEGRVVMPEAYVAALFDEYAPRFDRHLTGILGYIAPDLIAVALREEGGLSGIGRVLDLGCGTGLMARALPIPGAEWTGVDLSAAMLAKARETGLYARLEQAELCSHLGGEAAESVDLVLAADVFCYVADLAPVLCAAARVLAPAGRLAFTIQSQAGAGAILGADQRVHHAPALVRAAGAAAGLRLRRQQPVSARMDRGRPVPGMLFVFGRG